MYKTNQNKRTKKKNQKQLGKNSSEISNQTYQNYTRLLTRDYESQKILGRGHTDPERTQIPAQATIPSQTLNYHKWRNQSIPQQN